MRPASSMPNDKRVRAIALTQEGQALLNDALPLWREAQAESGRRLDGADWADVRAELDRLAA